MKPSMCNILVALLGTLVASCQAYRLEGEIEFRGDPSGELLRYLSKWINFHDVHTTDGSTLDASYSIHPFPEIIFETPDYYEEELPSSSTSEDEQFDLDHLSFMDKEHLKTAGSIEDIARITGLALLEEEEEDAEYTDVLNSDSQSLTSYYRRGVRPRQLRPRGDRGRSRGNSVSAAPMAKRALCEPEKVTEFLEASKGFRPVPSCIRVKKCGGCCNPGFVCVPTVTKQMNKTVIEMSLDSNTLKKKVVRQITEELECECQCSVREEHCHSTQIYDTDNCTCFCKPELETVRKECEDSRRLWDPSTCSCKCPLQGPHSEADCASGQTFDPFTCSCNYK